MCLEKKLKKNLAKERMQRLRRSLSIVSQTDKEKFKEICNVDLVSKKASQKSSRSLPSFSKHIKNKILYF